VRPVVEEQAENVAAAAAGGEAVGGEAAGGAGEGARAANDAPASSGAPAP